MIAITGETGSGKSVFISALEYMAGLRTKSQFTPSSFSSSKYTTTDSYYSLPNEKNKINRDCSVSITIQDSINGDRLIKREIPVTDNSNSNSHKKKAISNRSTSKTICKINGEKVTIKKVSAELNQLIRFWKADSINMLQSSAFVNYLDLYGGTIQMEMVSDIRSLYTTWIVSKNKLKKLKDLQKRMNEGNEFSLLSHYLTEIKQFEKKIASFFGELRAKLVEFEEEYDTTSSVKDYDDFDSFMGNDNILDLLHALPVVNFDNDDDDISDSNIDLVRAWRMINKSEIFLKRLMQLFGEFSLAFNFHTDTDTDTDTDNNSEYYE